MSAGPILSYCTNVHPGESLDELCALLRGPVARARRSARGEGAMGAGLWLPVDVARRLAEDEDAARRAREALEAAGSFAFTVNAFPIGGFHAERVKRDVYRPSWCEEARLVYTLQACRALARLLPDGARGSVSTVPVTYKAFPDSARPADAGANLGRLALELARLEAESGHEVALALEPEPLAYLETTPEAIRFLEEHVYAGAGRAVWTDAGRERPAAEAALRRFIGVCVDTCHLACAYEEVPASLDALERAGVRVVKAQLSSALELRAPGDPDARRRLRAFAEPRYLHQVAARLPGGGRLQLEDLPELFERPLARSDAQDRAELVAAAAAAEQVRVHFHVPLVWDGDAALGSTRAVLEEGLPALARATDHLEVETYTFSVLPADERARFEDDVVQMVAAELRWADAALARAGAPAR